MPLAHCIRPDHTEGETKYHDVEFKTNIVDLECQTSWQGCFRRVELCFFCCSLCYRNRVHSLVLQILGLV